LKLRASCQEEIWHPWEFHIFDSSFKRLSPACDWAPRTGKSGAEVVETYNNPGFGHQSTEMFRLLAHERKVAEGCGLKRRGSNVGGEFTGAEGLGCESLDFILGGRSKC